MSTNVLELARSYLSDDVLGQVSTMLGENQQHMQTAIDGALPVILGGLIHKSTDAGGIGGVMDMVAHVMAPNRAAGEVIVPGGGVFGHLSSLFDSNATQMSDFLSMGSGLVESLFGNKAGAIASALSTQSGIKQTSAASLLSLATPVVLGVLGQQLVANGGGLSELTGLLRSQVGNVQAAIPPELSSVLGTFPGTALTADADILSTTAKSDRSNASSRTTSSDAPVTTSPVAVGDVDRPVAGIPAFSNDHTSRNNNRWVPWLLLALGVAALLYFLVGCSNDRSGANTDKGTGLSDTANVASDANTDTKIGPAIDSIGSAVKATLDSAGKR